MAASMNDLLPCKSIVQLNGQIKISVMLLKIEIFLYQKCVHKTFLHGEPGKNDSTS